MQNFGVNKVCFGICGVVVNANFIYLLIFIYLFVIIIFLGGGGWGGGNQRVLWKFGSGEN